MENRWFIVVSGDGRIRSKKVRFSLADAKKEKDRIEKTGDIIGKLYILPIAADETNICLY